MFLVIFLFKEFVRILLGLFKKIDLYFLLETILCFNKILF